MSEDNEGSRFGDEFSRNRKCSQHFSQETNDAMACSDSPFTTWSKIKKNSNENLQLRRHPSGNNNTTDDGTNICSEINNASAVKSLSLPNLCRENQK